jgi:hypothetical protein
LQQLQRRHNFFEAAARTGHNIISGAHRGNLAFQPLERWGVYGAIQRHRVRNRSSCPQEAFKGQRLIELFDPRRSAVPELSSLAQRIAPTLSWWEAKAVECR